MREVYATFTDKLTNKKVYLYKKDYESIRDGTGKHSQSHSEIEKHFDEVKSAIEEPHQVRKDKDKKRHKKRKCYYKFFAVKGNPSGVHMKIITDREFLTNRLVVINAYLTNTINKNEKHIYGKIK